MLPPAPLTDDLIEEILIRIPPNDPASLFRAALVCKPWYRVASDPCFRRRFCARHHQAPPPVLGVLCNISGHGGTSRFIPTSSLRFHQPLPDRSRWLVLDSRHGRVLLTNWDRERGPVDDPLVIWDPITGDHLKLPELPRQQEWTSWNAAVLCAAGGCDHLNCHRGPFLVAVVGCGHGVLFGLVYSSEAGYWSLPTNSVEHADVDYLACAALVGNALYFKSEICIQAFRSKIIKYDLSTWKMSAFYLPYEMSLWSTFTIDLPLSRLEHGPRIVLMATEDEARLGFGAVRDSKLYLWEWEAVSGSVGDAGWAQSKVIDLQTLLPADANSISTELVGFADGVALFFVQTVHGLFSIDLKSGQVKKVYNGGDIDSVVPYMAFFTPGTSLVGSCFAIFHKLPYFS
jgi:hypothetical protein